MKRIRFIFAALVLTAGIAAISCTKENASSTSPDITNATDAVQIDNTVVDITGTIDDYEAANTTTFADPTLKASVVDGPMTMHFMGRRLDSCATVTVVKTWVNTGTVRTGATVSFTIDYGTTGCKSNKDGKTRSGTITSTYNWIKAGGWSRKSAVNLTVNDVQHVGTISATFGVIGANKHAYFTDSTTLKVTAKDLSWKTWTSVRNRELMEGNGGVNPVKIFKITGNSIFSNSKLETSTYTISNTDPLMKHSNCKTFTSGTVTIVNKVGVTTTIDYGTAGVDCPEGFTIKTPADKNGKGGGMKFIKWGK